MRRMHTIFTARRRATSGAPSGCRRGFHRVALALTGVAAAMVFMLVPTLASADTGSTLTVIGTSDVSDSGLIPNLIGPQFQQAFPQFTFKYIGTASGTAITSAETGSMGASALIVHAPTLENQFVAGGFSYQTTGSGPSTNPFGSAIWINDFVLAGPTGDPAGVAANGANNIAQAFADVATAGVAGEGDVRLPRRHRRHDDRGARDLGRCQQRRPDSRPVSRCAPFPPVSAAA